MNRLKITKATYYDSRIGFEEKKIDVTRELSAQITDDRLFYHGIYQYIFPDPSKGVRKKLTIELQYKGKSFTRFYNENDKIDLPNELGNLGKGWGWLLKILGGLTTLAFTIIGIYYAYYFNLNGNRQDGNAKPNQQVEQSPNSVNIVGNNNTVNRVDPDKPKVELKPFEINTPDSSPEIGFNSEYLLEIISDYTIADLPLKIKLPSSALEIEELVGMFKDNDATGNREFYESKLQDGYAFFSIKNAGGLYHLTFSSKQPEQLTSDDLVY